MQTSAKHAVDWVGLPDVAVAADRGFSPLGPELCGFVVLEAVSRVREVGGGVVDAAGLALGTQGHVALTAPPARGTEAEAVVALRSVLASLLALATSSTPALRQCARRKDPRATLASLERELLGALIPLNRQASRRGLSRVSRATLEAFEAGDLEDAGDRVPSAEEDPSPVPVVRKVRATPPPLPISPLPRAVALPVRAETPAAPRANTPAPPPRHLDTPPPQEVDEATVQQPTVVYGETPCEALAADASLDALADALDRFEAPDGELEIVSQLPPLVEGPAVAVGASPEVPPSVIVARDTVAEAARPTVAATDKVRQLVEGFSVSRERDDRTLSRDLKRMVDIETSVPPGVAETLPEPAPVDVDFGPGSPGMPPVGDVADSPPPMHKGPGAFLAFALAAAAFAIATLASRPGALSTFFASTAAPPGPLAPAALGAPVAAPAPPAACEGTLVVENAPKDAEVLRRIGVAPSSVVLPIGGPLDLVATLDGRAPRRLRVDKAMFKGDATGLAAQVSFAFESPVASAPWPALGMPASPMRSSEPRAVVRLSSAPASAVVWVVVEPAAVPVPCGAPVDLLVIGKPLASGNPGAERKSVRVEWSAFSGSPPRGTLRLPP